MRRIELRPNVLLLDGKPVFHVTWMAEMLLADASLGKGENWERAEAAYTIIDKIGNARGHAFLTDLEYEILLHAFSEFNTHSQIAVKGAGLGWQRAIIHAEEWVERDGQLVQKGK